MNIIKARLLRLAEETAELQTTAKEFIDEFVKNHESDYDTVFKTNATDWEKSYQEVSKDSDGKEKTCGIAMDEEFGAYYYNVVSRELYQKGLDFSDHSTDIITEVCLDLLLQKFYKNPKTKEMLSEELLTNAFNYIDNPNPYEMIQYIN